MRRNALRRSLGTFAADTALLSMQALRQSASNTFLPFPIRSTNVPRAAVCLGVKDFLLTMVLGSASRQIAVVIVSPSASSPNGTMATVKASLVSVLPFRFLVSFPVTAPSSRLR